MRRQVNGVPGVFLVLLVITQAKQRQPGLPDHTILCSLCVSEWLTFLSDKQLLVGKFGS